MPSGYCILTTDSFHPTQLDGPWVYEWNNFFVAVDALFQNGAKPDMAMQFIPSNEETMNDFKAMIYTLWVSNSKAVFIFDSTKCFQEVSVSVIRCPMSAVTAQK